MENNEERVDAVFNAAQHVANAGAQFAAEVIAEGFVKAQNVVYDAIEAGRKAALAKVGGVDEMTKVRDEVKKWYQKNTNTNMDEFIDKTTDEKVRSFWSEIKDNL